MCHSTYIWTIALDSSIAVWLGLERVAGQFHCQVTTLGMLFLHTQFTRASVIKVNLVLSVVLYGWEGNQGSNPTQGSGGE